MSRRGLRFPADRQTLRHLLPIQVRVAASRTRRMDLINTISGLQQTQTAQAIQVSVAKKALDAQRQQGAAAIQLIEAAGGTGGPGDALVAKATGLGGRIDVNG